MPLWLDYGLKAPTKFAHQLLREYQPTLEDIRTAPRVIMSMIVMDKSKGNPWGLKGKGIEGKGKGWDFSTLEPFIPLKKNYHIPSI